MFKEDFLLRWDLHEKTRATSLASLWKNEAFLDVTIACDDDQIDAHKVVLSAASPLFQKILLRNENHYGRPLLYFKGTKKKQMKALLEFVYRGEVNVNPEDLEDFMHLASSLEIEGLVGDMRETNEQSDKKTELKSTIGNFEKEEISSKHSAKKLYHNEEMEMGARETKLSVLDVEEFDVHKEESLLQDVDILETDLETINTDLVTTMEAYDMMVQKLMLKISDIGSKAYSCKECSYSGRKQHVQEHVGQHIKGFVFPCSICEKTLTTKLSLRHHSRRCKPTAVN